MDHFPVLMYHRIVSPRCPVPGGDLEETRYAVDLEEYRWQLGHISDSGRRGVSMRMAFDALADGGRVPSDWVILTFDDGNLSDHEHARPLLQERGFNATFFVGGNRVGVEGGLEPAMISGMAADRFDIGSHAMTHRFLSGLSEEEEAEELRRSKELLEELSGVPVDFFAPPGGRIGRRGIETLKQLSYRAVCTSEFGFNNCAGRRYEYLRIPVTAATSRGRFQDIVSASRRRLLPQYAKDRGLRLARRILGEAGYRRVRALGLGS
jgi:peptidoglycan/xylan/chitin deacetylase (PgdA/CDA1 family)